MARKATLEENLTVANNFFAAAKRHRATASTMVMSTYRFAEERCAARAEKEGDKYLAKAKALLPADQQISTNIMSGKLFVEAIDTPYTCSPRSETYWCS